MVLTKPSTGRFVPQGLAIPGDDFVYHSWEGVPPASGVETEILLPPTMHRTTLYNKEWANPKVYRAEVDNLLCVSPSKFRLHMPLAANLHLCAWYDFSIWIAVSRGPTHAHFKNNIMREKSMLQIMEYKHSFFVFFLSCSTALKFIFSHFCWSDNCFTTRFVPHSNMNPLYMPIAPSFPPLASVLLRVAAEPGLNAFAPRAASHWLCFYTRYCTYANRTSQRSKRPILKRKTWSQ